MADTNRGDTGETVWERDLIEKLALESLKEQRRKRRWSIFFRVLLFSYLFLLLYVAVNGNMSAEDIKAGDHTALIAIDDVIAPREKGISADQVARGLKNAYKDKSTRGIILQINSPGGSPVQSARIFAEIRRLRKEHKEIPVYAVIGDIGASGAYYAAVAADEIYANESSIVGSIGVRMGQFGFVDAMEKLGVERRVITSGQNKISLDPFMPLKDDDRAHAEKMLSEVHQQFIQAVRDGRGERLKESDEIFTGLFWSGATAKSLGLIDGFGDSRYVAAELIGEKRLVDFTARENTLDRLISKFGLGVGTAFTRMMKASSTTEIR